MKDISSIKTRVKVLKSARRNTLYKKIVENGISIMDLSKATGIKSDRLYRIFEIPSGDELAAIEQAIDHVVLATQNEVLKEAEGLEEWANSAPLSERDSDEAFIPIEAFNAITVISNITQTKPFPITAEFGKVLNAEKSGNVTSAPLSDQVDMKSDKELSELNEDFINN